MSSHAWIVVAALPLLAAAPVTPRLIASRAPVATHATLIPARPLSGAALTAVLDTAMQDEHFARSVYERVLRDHGQAMPFANIVWAEQRHAEHIAALMTARGAAVPPSRWSADAVPSFPTLRAACEAALRAEGENIAMYDRLLRLDLPDDARTVFEQNRWASVERHTPAFERCLARTR